MPHSSTSSVSATSSVRTVLRGESSRTRRVAAAALVAGVLLVVSAGCTESSTTASAAPSVAAAPAAGAAAGPAAGAAAAKSTGSSAGSGAAGSSNVDVGAEAEAADRQVIKTANLTLDVVVTSSNTTADADRTAEQKAVDQAAQQVRNLATGAGYVSAAQGSGATESVTLRVPAAGYDTVMSAIEKIAPVGSLQESTEDVTSKVVDISSRLQTMTASVDRVRLLLSKADKIGDVIAIESELSSREADLESLQRQQAALAGQTALSTITVVVQGSITGVRSPAGAPPPAARTGFVGGLANGWDAVRHLGSAVLVVVGTLLPFVPVVAVVLGIGWYVRRRVRRDPAPGLPAIQDPQAAE